MPKSKKYKVGPKVRNVNGQTEREGWAYHPTKGWRRICRKRMDAALKGALGFPNYR